MNTDSIEVSGVIAARPEEIFAAWLDSEGHQAMTGSPASCDGPEVGAKFTAWDGYISGHTVALEAPNKIVQKWRTTSFGADDPDSDLTVLLEPEASGTKVTFVHSNIPTGQGRDYEGGWVTHYLDPMKKRWG
jgi:activator of HSP90 ATPase